MYCALIAYIIFEGPAEDRNMNTLVDMISGMEVKEDGLTRIIRRVFGRVFCYTGKLMITRIIIPWFGRQ